MTSVNGQYLQGFVVPVGTANKDAYRDMAARAWPMFQEYGALSIVEAWGEDVPDGTVTDFRRAVQAQDDETVVFSWIVWPDRATCDAAGERMRTDERMKPDDPMPFDGKRMIYAGFAPIFQAGN
ncbi:DUF1428 domain-containing protein [Sphingomonas sp.]|uniref:DUF1428 domain-containing protein n=1 Tax=Sphingomonas sp. TaxID=28214 RepID=UPI0035B49C75